MNGTLTATVCPDFESVALKIEAMPLRLTTLSILKRLSKHIANFDLEGHGNLCFVKDGLTAEIAQRVDAFDLNDLNRKVVVGAAPFGQLNQLAASFVAAIFW